MTKEIYTVENVCRILNSISGIQIKGKSIKITKTAIIGTKTWGKIDFLKRNGYTQEYVDAISDKIKSNKDSKEEFEVKKRKKKNIGIDVLSGVKAIMKPSNFKIKK